MATPGIGPGVAALLDEYRSSGEIESLQSLRDAYPVEARRLRRLPRMSPALQRSMKAGLGIETTTDLLAAIESGAAETLKGVGPQTLELWAKILDLPPSPVHAPAHEAWVAARSLADHITSHTGLWVDIAGDVRRVEEWVALIDLLVVGRDVESVEPFVMTSAALMGTVSREGTVSGSTLDGIPVSISEAAPEESGTKLIWRTGPQEHAALVGSEPFPTEAETYRAAGLDLVPPPARSLPLDLASRVVDVGDLRGDFHLHSESSPDGRMTLEAIVDEAIERSYEYILITDHTHGLRFGGLGPEGIEAQAEMIERIRATTPALRIFHGAELNIGPDGELDLPDETLGMLDFAVAGVHSHFQLDSTAKTQRVLVALRHPVVRVLAHPLGRRIGIRPGLDLDVDAVIEAAIAERVALEANGHRDRLDLPPDWVHSANERGAVFAANSDAHRIAEIDNVENAVAVLQKAGVEASRVVNTWPLADLERWVQQGATVASSTRDGREGASRSDV